MNLKSTVGNNFTSKFNKEGLFYIKLSMLVINIIAVLFILALVYLTTKHIYLHHIASDFLHSVEAIPVNPNLLWLGLTFLLILSISFFIRETFLTKKVTAITLSIDFIVIIFIIVMVHFNYNGILFWFFANVIYYIKDNRSRFGFFILAILTLLLTDYKILAIRYSIFSVDSYIAYYSSIEQQYLTGIVNGLISINIIIFIIFCINVINEQRGIITEVNKLYYDLSEANKKLTIANNELKEYANLKEKMGETRERNRLAREIHDTLGHTLTGISAGVDACIELVEKSPELTKNQLIMISQVIRQGIMDIRSSVSKLRPDALKHQELETAIIKMINKTSKLTNTIIHFDCNVKNLKFDVDEENAIYRIIQESLTNAIRHGNATLIKVKITKENEKLLLEIQDNGIGCQKLTQGFGTKHIIERVKLLNGCVSFYGKNGFTVKATIPIRWGE